MPGKELFNRLYAEEQWAPILLRPHAFSTTRYDDVARLLLPERGRVLEFGCGSGGLLIALAERFDEAVGVDLSDRRIALARRILAERYPQYSGKLRFQCIGGGEPLPFEDASFDVIIACVVLEAVPDVFATMDELARVCRPGGCLLATVANVCYIRHILGMLAGRIPVTWAPTRDIGEWRRCGWDGGCLRYFSKHALSQLLLHTGFDPEKWSGSGRWARLRRWCPALCGDLCVRARRRRQR